MLHGGVVGMRREALDTLLSTETHQTGNANLRQCWLELELKTREHPFGEDWDQIIGLGPHFSHT